MFYLLDLAREGKILLEDEKESSNQISVIFGSLNPIVLCNFVEICNCGDALAALPPKMIKFGDFEPIDVNLSSFLHVLVKVILEQQSLEENQSCGDHIDDEGWILVTRRRCSKISSRREPSKQVTRGRMKKLPKTQRVKKATKKSRIEENYYQKSRSPITLDEFLPSWFHMKISHCDAQISCCNVDKKIATKDSPPSLLPSQEGLIRSSSEEVNTTDAKLTFPNDDLLLGEIVHNRPLYMVGFVRGHKVNRIMVDDGSGVNILPIRTVKELGISMDELSESRLMIQGFNQGGQRAIDAVKLDTRMGDMCSSAWMHVIDSKTSYNILLGRPWIHENKVVPSTYH